VLRFFQRELSCYPKLAEFSSHFHFFSVRWLPIQFCKLNFAFPFIDGVFLFTAERCRGVLGSFESEKSQQSGRQAGKVIRCELILKCENVQGNSKWIPALDS